MEDAELVEKMKGGDKHAFDMLYEKYKDMVCRTAYLITGSHADGEDVMQETFIKVYLHCRELRKNDQFRFWLFRILNRTAWQMAKKQKREQPDEHILEKADKETAHSSDDALFQMDRDSRIWQAVSSLEARQRTVIVLYYYNGLSTKQIAQIMQCMEGTVKSRLYTARKRLYPLLLADLSKEDIYYGTKIL